MKQVQGWRAGTCAIRSHAAASVVVCSKRHPMLLSTAQPHQLLCLSCGSAWRAPPVGLPT